MYFSNDTPLNRTRKIPAEKPFKRQTIASVFLTVVTFPPIECSVKIRSSPPTLIKLNFSRLKRQRKQENKRKQNKKNSTAPLRLPPQTSSTIRAGQAGRDNWLGIELTSRSNRFNKLSKSPIICVAVLCKHSVGQCARGYTTSLSGADIAHRLPIPPAP